MTDEAPKLENAPGVIWRRRAGGWEARWQCRTDLIERGFVPKSVKLWAGEWPTEVDAAVIQTRAGNIHAEMLTFSAGLRGPVINAYDGTLKGLVSAYQTDKDSTYRKLRYHVRKNHDSLLKRIVKQHGDIDLALIKARTILGWHEEWTGDEGKKIAMGHAFVTMLRTLSAFGMTMLEDEQCERLSLVMSKMKFKASKPRTDFITPEQAILIRIEAHKRGWHSIALAQAIQFEAMLRQKDVIGEWVPLSEPGTSDVTSRRLKWLRGLRWSEIDENLMVRHVTSKKDKPIEVNLRLSPMVLEELAFYGPRPSAGPMIICEQTGRPWDHNEFRRKWRILADAAGIPKAVKNMDSRAGAITEATEGGADIEHVKHAATHSNITTTQRYARVTAGKIENVQQHRLAHRNKPRTEKP